ncbi:MAG: Meiotic recombination protein dmc1, partial [Paramarteilia canceri]
MPAATSEKKASKSQSKEIGLNECESFADAGEEGFDMHDIELLQEHGINVADLKKLKNAGINTIKGLFMTTTKKLLSVKGISDAKVEKIKEAAKIFDSESSKFFTALELAEKRQSVFRISTGSSDFDRLLGGGIESQSITEVFGEFRTGKTQISHTLCVTAQIPNENYQGGKVIFIDTENTFRPNRLREIAERFNLDQEVVLQNVLYA